MVLDLTLADIDRLTRQFNRRFTAERDALPDAAYRAGRRLQFEIGILTGGGRAIFHPGIRVDVVKALDAFVEARREQ